VTTLVLAAYAPELAGLSTVNGLFSRAIGVGLVESSAGAERAISEVRPDRVLLIGTAGALPCAHVFAIGELAVAHGARLVARPGESLPEPMPRGVAAHAALSSQMAAALGARQAWVACPIGITETDGEAARLAADAELEHLELFSVLRTAERAGIPATAIFCIANHVGSRARAEWRTHRAAAEASAIAAAMRVL
jgi:nucleoside phosphorylase